MSEEEKEAQEQVVNFLESLKAIKEDLNHNFDHVETFQEIIQPLVKEIHEKSEEHGFNVLFVAQIKREDTGATTENGVSMMMHMDRKEAPELTELSEYAEFKFSSGSFKEFQKLKQESKRSNHH
jgi:hypothetical protein